jgi:hypothetical protein
VEQTHPEARDIGEVGKDEDGAAEEDEVDVGEHPGEVLTLMGGEVVAVRVALRHAAVAASHHA